MMKKVFIIILAVTISTIFFSCEKMFIEPPKNNPVAIFENIWQTFNEEYAPFEERNVDWQLAYDTFRPQVNPNTTDVELFAIISEMLKLFDDGHISLTAPNRQVFFSNRIRRDLIDDNLFNKTVHYCPIKI